MFEQAKGSNLKTLCSAWLLFSMPDGHGRHPYMTVPMNSDLKGRDWQYHWPHHASMTSG